MPRKVKSSRQSTIKKYFRQLQPRQMVGLALLVAIVGGLGWLIISQASQAISSANKLKVVATFYPLYDFSQQIGGDLAEVTNLTSAGGDAHNFEPTPQDIHTVLDADLFIYNNPTMEPWVAKILNDYTKTAVEADHSIEHHHEEEHEDQHDHQADPHTWTDPVLAQDLVQAIADGFKQADPDHASTYQANATNYIAQLARLDQDFQTGLATCQHRTIITSHAAFSFMAERYNLTVLPIAGLSPDQEPGAAQLAQLAKLVKQHQIGYIFFETQASQQLAQALANETGVETAVLDPLENLSPAALSQGQDYLSVQRTNLANLRQALTCS